MGSYRVKVSSDGRNWKAVDGGKTFVGNSGANNKKKEHRFAAPVMARFVRFVVQSWNRHISMRAAVLACKKTKTSGRRGRKKKKSGQKGRKRGRSGKKFRFSTLACSTAPAAGVQLAASQCRECTMAEQAECGPLAMSF